MTKIPARVEFQPGLRFSPVWAARAEISSRQHEIANNFSPV
jgi:hypothetical protein